MQRFCVLGVLGVGAATATVGCMSGETFFVIFVLIGFYLVFLIVFGSRLWVSLGVWGFPCVFGLLGISVGL